jgi:ATP-binding cassette subfamily B protein
MEFYRRSISYFRRDWHWITLFLILVAASLAIGLMQAWPMAVLVDVVLNQKPQNASWAERLFLFALPNRRLAQVIGVTLIGMGMKFAQDTIGAVKTMVNNRFIYNGRLRVRCQLFAKLQDLSMRYHHSLPQGDAIYRVLNDTFGPDQILNVLLNSFTAAVTLVAMVGIMLTRNVPLTIFAISVAPLLIITNHYFGKVIKRGSVEMKVADTRVTTLVQRAMTAVGLVQAFNRQRSEYAGFRSAADASSRTNYNLAKYQALAGFSVQSIYTLGGAVIFGYGGYLVYRDQFLHPRPGGFTCGDVMVFMAYLGSLWEPLRVLTSTKADVQTGVVGAERVFEVLDQEQEIADPPGTPELPMDIAACPIPHLPMRSRDLSMEDVSFAYTPGKPVLKHINANIAPGQLVSFVGPSGAGKSTLLQLIPRFYDPTSGSVQLDGVDLRSIPVADVRRHVALVSQDNLLLPTTIGENIAYGRPEASQDEIEQAAALAGADEFINDLPERYDTPVSEGGQNLSGGQRQRVAIARAILSEAPIIVMDEPTSALDPVTSMKVMHNLQQLRRHRTVVVVTHHVASVAGFDRIYVMKAGEIVEQGTHEQLMKLNGLYAELLHSEPTVEPAVAGGPRMSVA